jgi:hypothetical protein
VAAASSAVPNKQIDLLALALLEKDTLSWQDVELANPPMAMGNFVGSRESSVDTVFGLNGEDSNAYGFPSPTDYVMNLSNILEGGAPMSGVKTAAPHYNTSKVADGLIGGHLPIAHYHFPVLQSSPYLPPGVNMTETRSWDMIAAAMPSTNGSRENYVWFRFQQIACPLQQHSIVSPSSSSSSSSSSLLSSLGCTLHGKPLYFDTYWWSNSPDGRTNLTGPAAPSQAAGFYAALLENRQYWDSELASEGMMSFSLPSPASTNGTWLKTQALASVIRVMLTRKDTWGQRCVIHVQCTLALYKIALHYLTDFSHRMSQSCWDMSAVQTTLRSVNS